MEDSKLFAGTNIPIGRGYIYVSRAADDEVFQRLTAGELTYVLAPRKSGKSSLGRRIKERLEQNSVVTSYIDLSTLGLDSPDRWYLSLATQVVDGLSKTIAREGLDGLWELSERLSPVLRWRYFLQALSAKIGDRPLILFLDELDSLRQRSNDLHPGTPGLCDDLLAAIRAIHSTRDQSDLGHHLTFCLLGVMSPAELISDQGRTPFNIGQEVQLADFSRDELEPFAKVLEGDASSQKQVLDLTFGWTNGHPHMTQSLLMEYLNKSRPVVDPDVEIAALVSRLFMSGARNDSTVEEVRRRLDLEKNTERYLPLLQLYGQLLDDERVPFLPHDPDQRALLLTGLAGIRGLESSQPVLVKRNRILSTRFDRQWLMQRESEHELGRNALVWERQERVSSLLLTGPALLKAHAYAEGKAVLSWIERTYLLESIEHQRRQEQQVLGRRAFRYLLATIGLSIVLLGVLLLWNWADYNAEEARKQRLKVEKMESEIALKQIEEATELRNQAEEQRREAVEQRTAAEKQRQREVELRTEADLQRAEADWQRAEALEQRTEADRQRQEADRQRGEAVKSRDEAHQMRAQAESEKKVLESLERANRLADKLRLRLAAQRLDQRMKESPRNSHRKQCMPVPEPSPEEHVLLDQLTALGNCGVACMDNTWVCPGSSTCSADGACQFLERFPNSSPLERKIEMVYVPGGRVIMGCHPSKQGPCESDEGLKAESVEAFKIDRVEVSVEDYLRCEDALACQPAHSGPGCPDYRSAKGSKTTPMVCVTQTEAATFCKWREDARLPTEEQWERAARGDDDRTYPWGDCPPTSEWAAYQGYQPFGPVGVSMIHAGAGPFGTWQQAGNVAEWTATSSAEKRGRAEGESKRFVVRGGSFRSEPRSLAVFSRVQYPAGTVRPDVGFRCVKPLERTSTTSQELPRERWKNSKAHCQMQLEPSEKESAGESSTRLEPHSDRAP